MICDLSIILCSLCKPMSKNKARGDCGRILNQTGVESFFYKCGQTDMFILCFRGLGLMD